MAMKIEILINDAGQLQVTGNIENLMIVYGVLEAAKDALREHHQQQAKNIIQPAGGLMLPKMPGS